MLVEIRSVLQLGLKMSTTRSAAWPDVKKSRQSRLSIMNQESEDPLLKPATRRTIGFDQGERQQHGEKQEEDNCRSSQQFLHLLVAFPFLKVSASFLFSFALLPQRVITKVTITEFLRIGDQKAHLSLLPLCSQCHFYHFLESALMVGNRQN